MASVHPSTNLLMVQKSPPSPKHPSVNNNNTNNNNNNSIISLNPSFLHQSYQSYMQPQISNSPECAYCKCSPNNYKQNTIQICECQKLYHQQCLKQHIKQCIIKQQNNVKVYQGCSYLKCQQCEYKMKFKHTSKWMLKNKKQIQKYIIQHKLFSFGVILVSILVMVCLIFIVCIATNVVYIQQDRLQRQVLLIGFGFLSGILFIIGICCCLECLKKQQIQVDAVYSRQQRSRRSSRSRLSNRSRVSNRSRSKGDHSPRQVVIVTIE